MRKILFKKIFVSLVLIAMLGVISAGCGTTAPPVGPVGPVGPTTYTVTIVSANSLCYGTVYVAGSPTSSYLLTCGDRLLFIMFHQEQLST